MTPPSAVIRAKMGLYGHAVKKAFLLLDLRARCRARAGSGREEIDLAQPRLLLIDDEPALADFLANAARECGFEPVVTSNDTEFRETFKRHGPTAVALDFGMPGMDGVELLRFLAEKDYRSPVLIVSGFDRRVLEFAFRLGEALGLNMAGPSKSPSGSKLSSGPQPASCDARDHEPQGERTAARGLQTGAGRAASHMVYQPKVAMRQGDLTRVEALVRWDDPELGRVEPSRFVPLAEEHGLIDELTQWGLRTILRQWLDWREKGIDTHLAFNISALSLEHLDFPDLSSVCAERSMFRRIGWSSSLPKARPNRWSS